MRATVVTMTATLATFGSAWLIEDLAHLHTDMVVLAVVLAVMSGRTQRANDRRDRLISVAVLPPAAAVAGAIGLLTDRHTVAGDTLMVLAVAGAIWIRRFGPRFAKAGTQATLPFIAGLVTPVPPSDGAAHLLWAALLALIAVAWVTAAQVIAAHAGVTATPPCRYPTTPSRPTTARIPASTRMAVQMAAALAAAYLVAHRLYPDHWTWVVLTAYIVASGNRGRGDVVHKGGLRIAGAAVGTVLATPLAGTFPTGDKWAIVVIFAILTLATWLRSISYAFWAGSVTAALVFLYGYFGESGAGLLRTRLEGIAYGAAMALAASWWILPVRTQDVIRRRLADTLAVLTDYLAATRRDPGRLHHHQTRFDHALAQLEQVAAPLRRYRFLLRRRGPGTHPADTIPALRRCRTSIHDLTKSTAADPELLTDPDVATALSTLLANVIATRRAMSSTPATTTSPPAAPHPSSPICKPQSPRSPPP